MRVLVIAVASLAAFLTTAWADDGSTTSFDFPNYTVTVTLLDTSGGCALTNAEVRNTSGQVLRPVEIDLHASQAGGSKAVPIAFPAVQAGSSLGMGQNTLLGTGACESFTLTAEGTPG